MRTGPRPRRAPRTLRAEQLEDRACPAIVASGSAVDIPLGPVHPGDQIVLTVLLRSDDPNENGEGEPLQVFSTGGFHATVRNYASARHLSFQATQEGEAVEALIDGYDGDETGEVTAAVNPPDKQFFSQDVKDIFEGAADLLAVDADRMAEEGVEIGKDAVIDLFKDAAIDAVLKKLAKDFLPGVKYGQVAIDAIHFYQETREDFAAADAVLSGHPEEVFPVTYQIAVYEIAAGTAFLASRALNALAGDPPDANYTAAAAPAPAFVVLDIDPPAGTPDLRDPVNRLLVNLSESAAVATALTTAINRASGARVAGDAYWEGQQTRAAHRYMAQLGALLDAQVGLRQDFVAATTAAGFAAAATPDDVLGFEGNLAGRGLPPFLAQVLAGLGADSAAAQEVLDLAKVQDTTQVAGDLVAGVADPALLAALRQTAAALRASAGPTLAASFAVGSGSGGGAVRAAGTTAPAPVAAAAFGGDPPGGVPGGDRRRGRGRHPGHGPGHRPGFPDPGGGGQRGG